MKVGDKVYLEHLRNGRGLPETGRMTEREIEKIGRKWISLKDVQRHQFDVATGKQNPTEYMDAFRVWYDLQDYENYMWDLHIRAEFDRAIQNPRKYDLATLEAALKILVP